jgi:hypothetical protein
MRRYTDSTVYILGRARGASNSPRRVREAIEAGTLDYEERVLQEGERLDAIAGELYGDSTMWWAIAAASGIGWSLQVPPGTRVLVPVLSQLQRIV